MNTISIVLVAGLAIWIFEQVRPAKMLPRVSSWYQRALLLNGLQGLSALITANTFDIWFSGLSIFSIAGLSLAVQVALAYLAITFCYYWWHRARHHAGFLWRWLHQVHHSPARVEVLMSFYKHPIEVMINGALSSAIIFLLLGASFQAAVIAVMITGLAELFYHMNIATPRWLGFIFQRPEMHRVHHQRGWHHQNYSDLPLWDMLFGTFHNPIDSPNDVGFPNQAETRLGSLLLGRRFET
jgi:sterol desaturase/sphingolipid hydroxylase (fatty acid hydroxylase superfamily)